MRTRIEALTSSGLINAAANRRAMRVGQEPLDLFREYMATYAREQAYCHLSPALVRNLEHALECPRAQRLTRRSGTRPRRSRASELEALQLERLRETVRARAARRQRLGAARLPRPESTRRG